MAGTSFAVCAGNMYAAEFILRVSQRIAKADDIAEPFFKRRGANTAEHGQLAVKVFDGFFVRHRYKDKQRVQSYP